MEVEPLAARDDGGRHLVGLGGGQHEDDVRRRLLQRLQEGVEGLGRQHVHLVHQIHLVPPGHRRQAHPIAQLADLVDPTIAGGVHLHQIHGPPLEVGLAGLARVARLALRRLEAVHRLGQKAAHAGLARATGAAEQVGVGHPAAGQGVAHRLGDGILTHHLRERLGTPLTIKDFAVTAAAAQKSHRKTQRIEAIID